MVVVKENAVHERIDEFSAPFELSDVDLTVIAQRHLKFVLRKDGRFFAFFGDRLHEHRLLLFQFRQPRDQRIRRRTLLNGADDVPDLLLPLPALLFQMRQDRALLVLQLVEKLCKPLDDLVRSQQFHRLAHDKILDLLFLRLLLVAEVFARAVADVIAIGLSRAARAGICRHHCPAMPAEEVRREQIIVVLTVCGGRDGMLLNGRLHLLEHLFGDERGKRMFEHDARVTVLPEINAVGEQIQHAVVGNGLAVGAAHLFLLEIIVNLLGGIAVRAHLEHLLHDGGGSLIDFEFMVDDLIAERHRAAVPLALEGVLLEPALDVLREICRIEFSHAFKEAFEDDALGAVGDVLLRGHDAHAVLAESVAIERRVVTIAGEAVELPDEDDVKELLCAILDHALEVRAVVRLGRKRPVYVCSNDLQIVILGILRAFPDLPFDALFPLCIGRIPGVNDCFHYFTNLRQNDVYVLFCSSC